MSDPVQGAGYSNSKVETDATTLALETDTAASASGQVVCQEISKEVRYLADMQQLTLKPLLMGQRQ
jgi:hypothetical protein